MGSIRLRIDPDSARHGAHRSLLGKLAVLLCLSFSVGCAAITNPVADGIPVRRVPPELLGTPRANQRLLPLNLLRQEPPEVYRLESGDVLGVYIEGVLGERNQLPPVRLGGEGTVPLPPAMGFPVPVRENGTVSLPLIDPLPVAGMTLVEAEEAVRQAYTVKKEILKPGRERIIVTLLEKRTYSVLVVRQDGGSGLGASVPVSFGSFSGSSEVIGPRKKSNGFDLELPAYENDLLNALTRTGGLPGLDARNEVVIFRARSRAKGDQALAKQLVAQCPSSNDWDSVAQAAGVEVIRVPLRLPPGTPPPFRPEDILLHTGDIVLVPSRDPELFYTGGLLISGQYPLPRDYDLDVVQAIAVVRGPLISGGQNTNNLSGSTQNGGLGQPNPTLVSVVRRTPDGGQVTIIVNLNRALQDPRERILIQPNDLIVLQNTPGEALGSYFASIFRFGFVGTILRQTDATAITTLSGP